jgi:hypothetical protein
MNKCIFFVILAIFFWSFLMDYTNDEFVEKSKNLIIKNMNNSSPYNGTHSFINAIKNYKHTTVTFISSTLSYILKFLPVTNFFNRFIRKLNFNFYFLRNFLMRVEFCFWLLSLHLF